MTAHGRNGAIIQIPPSAPEHNMTEVLSIRPFMEGDFEAVAALWQSCGLTRSWNDPEQDIASCRANPTSELFVGLLDDQIVSSVMAGNDGHRGAVYYVASDPEHQGKGYAKQMIRHAEDWLNCRGVWKVNLMIRDDNEKARGFYNAIGYEEEARINMSRRLESASKDQQLECIVTYLQMDEPPTRPAPPTPAKHIALLHSENPSVGFYRYLYESVGAGWLWYERRVIDDDTLAAQVIDPLVEIFVLYVGGTPAGYFELSLREMPEIELAYFGLLPDFIGQGLGSFLLRQAIDQAWSHNPERLWVHTCNFDHPDALAVYQRAGFEPYDQQTTYVDDPRILRPDLDWT
jgi:GNAT superfamily N-acetyltransferase